MADYTLNFSDPVKTPLTVPQGSRDNSTSLVLLGQGTIQYGSDEQTNFLHLLENFSSNTAPINGIEGQLWYDNSTSQYNFFNGATWDPLVSASVIGSGTTYFQTNASSLEGVVDSANAFTITSASFSVNSPQMIFLGGSAAQPSIALNSGNSGIYSTLADNVSVSSSGVELARFRHVTGTAQLRLGAGTSAAPNLASIPDVNTGFNLKSSSVDAIVDGSDSFTIDSTGIGFDAGTSSDPNLHMNASADSGIHFNRLNNATRMGFSSNGDLMGYMGGFGFSNIPQVQMQTDGSSNTSPQYSFFGNSLTGLGSNDPDSLLHLNLGAEKVFESQLIPGGIFSDYVSTVFPGRLTVTRSGSISDPALSMNALQSTGLYTAGVGTMGVTVEGGKVLTFNNTGANTQTILTNGSFALPSLAFDSSPGTGLSFDNSGGALDASHGGLIKLRITSGSSRFYVGAGTDHMLGINTNGVNIGGASTTPINKVENIQQIYAGAVCVRDDPLDPYAGFAPAGILTAAQANLPPGWTAELGSGATWVRITHNLAMTNPLLNMSVQITHIETYLSGFTNTIQYYHEHNGAGNALILPANEFIVYTGDNNNDNLETMGFGFSFTVTIV